MNPLTTCQPGRAAASFNELENEWYGWICSEKEVMAYQMYTKENLERRNLPMQECVKYVKAEHQDVKQFQDNCKKWGVVRTVDKKKVVDIYEYSATYCLVDCDVLCQAYAAFDKLMHPVCVHDGGSLRPLQRR